MMTSAGCARTVDLTKMAIKFCTNVHNAIAPPYEIEEVGLGRAGKIQEACQGRKSQPGAKRQSLHREDSRKIVGRLEA